MLSKSDQILNFLHTNVQILSNWIICGTIQQFIYSNIQNFFFQILSENEKRQNVCDTMLLIVNKVKRLLQGQWRNCVYWEGTWMPTIPDVGSFRQGVPPTWFSTLSAFWSQNYNQTHSSDWKIFWRFIEFIVHPLYKSLFYLLAA